MSGTQDWSLYNRYITVCSCNFRSCGSYIFQTRPFVTPIAWGLHSPNTALYHKYSSEINFVSIFITLLQDLGSQLTDDDTNYKWTLEVKCVGVTDMSLSVTMYGDHWHCASQHWSHSTDWCWPPELQCRVTPATPPHSHQPGLDLFGQEKPSVAQAAGLQRAVEWAEWDPCQVLTYPTIPTLLSLTQRPEKELNN